jgi:hypothetical protein
MSTGQQTIVTKRARDSQMRVERLTPEFLFPDLNTDDLTLHMREEITIYSAIYYMSSKEIANGIFAKMRTTEQICDLPGSFGYEIFVAKFKTVPVLGLEFEIRKVKVANTRIIDYINYRIDTESTEYTRTTENQEIEAILDKIYGDVSQLTPFAQAIRYCDKNAIECLRWLSTTNYSYKDMCALVGLKSRGLVLPFEFYWEEKFANEVDDELLQVAVRNNCNFLVKFLISRFWSKFTPKMVSDLVFFLLSRKRDIALAAIITEKIRIKFDRKEQNFFFKRYSEAENKEPEFEMLKFIIKSMCINANEYFSMAIKREDFGMINFLNVNCYHWMTTSDLINACRTGNFEIIKFIISKGNSDIFNKEFLNYLDRSSQEIQDYMNKNHRNRINEAREPTRRSYYESRRLGRNINP